MNRMSNKILKSINHKRAAVLSFALFSAMYGGLPAQCATQVSTTLLAVIQQSGVDGMRIPNLSDKEILLVMPNAQANKDGQEDAFGELHGIVLDSNWQRAKEDM